jgi:hypothetical protein
VCRLGEDADVEVLTIVDIIGWNRELSGKKTKLSWTTGQEREQRRYHNEQRRGTFTKHNRRQPTEPNARRKRESGKRGGARLEAPHAHCGEEEEALFSLYVYWPGIAQPSYYFESPKNKITGELTFFFSPSFTVILFLDFQNRESLSNAVVHTHTPSGTDQLRYKLSYGRPSVAVVCMQHSRRQEWWA